MPNLAFFNSIDVFGSYGALTIFGDVSETMIIPGVINPRHACAARVTFLCLCVCLPVKSHLTYGASVSPENAVTYSAAKNICNDLLETIAFMSEKPKC